MTNDQKWMVIENLVTLALIGFLYYISKSFWCFLLLMNLNFIRKQK